eukprot:1137613-Pelagomonas_calceolata.AAC.6
MGFDLQPESHQWQPLAPLSSPQRMNPLRAQLTPIDMTKGKEKTTACLKDSSLIALLQVATTFQSMQEHE